MIIDLIIPTRGTERADFVAFALNEQIPRQTWQPNNVEVIAHEPKGGNDLVERYRTGIEYSFEKNRADFILFWEDDDYYASNYIQTMAEEWIKAKKPEAIGLNRTTYYHIKDLKYKHHLHEGRASMFSTGIGFKAKEHIQYKTMRNMFDIQLWHDLNGHTFYKPKLALGIKHGVGLCGGQGHKSSYMDQHDPNMTYLREQVEPYAFDFYYQMHRKLNNTPK